MRVALVNPSNPEYEALRGLLDRVTGLEEPELVPNLALLSLAPYFGTDVEAVYCDEDLLAQKGRPRSYLDEPFDLVFVTALTHQAHRAYEIAHAFRARGIPVVMGGLHASALPREAARHVDAVVVGEGEPVARSIIDDFRLNSLLPLYLERRPFDLAEALPPALELAGDLREYTKVPALATRGCPRGCSFCCLHGIYGRRHRKKRPGQVAAEIGKALALRPGAFVSFADENLLVDRAYARALLEALEPHSFAWEAYCDVSVADDPELLDALRNAGCRELIIGFESVSAASLEASSPWKARRRASYADSIEKIQSRGIAVLACFVVGFDEDGPGVFDELVAFLRLARPRELDVAVLTPLPGSPLARRLKREGRITSLHWPRYNWYHLNFRAAQMDEEAIQGGILRVFREFGEYGTARPA